MAEDEKLPTQPGYYWVTVDGAEREVVRVAPIGSGPQLYVLRYGYNAMYVDNAIFTGWRGPLAETGG